MKKPVITVIGGGTGQSTILRGLKKHDIDLNAIVTMADDGGGTGVLRKENGMLPPGDIRNCILSLSNIEPAMEQLLQHRFKEGRNKGQNFGNLFLAALNEIYGDFYIAVSKISEILAVKGKVLPVTLEDIKIKAYLENGTTILGESKIAEKCILENTQINKIQLVPKKVKPFNDAIEAIKKSDVIIVGPGSLYTSIIPNLLVDGIVDAINASGAIKIYVCNIMTEDGETNDYNVVNFLNAIIKHSNSDFFDYIIANDENITGKIKEKYLNKNQKQVIIDDKQRKYIENKNIKVITTNLVEIKNDLIYHNSNLLSKIIMEIIKYEELLNFVSVFNNKYFLI